MRKTKLECLSMIIYEPLKWVANGSCENKELEKFATQVIAILESENQTVDFERFEDMQGNDLRRSLWRLIRNIK